MCMVSDDRQGTAADKILLNDGWHEARIILFVQEGIGIIIARFFHALPVVGDCCCKRENEQHYEMRRLVLTVREATGVGVKMS